MNLDRIAAFALVIGLAVVLVPGSASHAAPPAQRDDLPGEGLPQTRVDLPQSTAYYVDAVDGHDTTGDGSVGNPWQTITHALSQSLGPGVDIHVAGGLYDESLGESFPITMEPGVSLLGAGYPATTISGNGSDDVIRFSSAVVYTETTVLSGFKITNGLAGVLVEGSTGGGSSPTVQSNWLTGNTRGILNSAIYNGRRVYTIIRGNLISNNTVYGVYNYAYDYRNHASPTIQNNQIMDNGDAGIFCYATGSAGNTSHSSPVIANNYIARNGKNGIWCATYYAGNCSPQLIANQVVDNQDRGFSRSHTGSYLATSRPKFVDNVFANNTMHGVIFYSGDRPTLVNNTVAYNGGYGVAGGVPTIVNCIVWGHDDDLIVFVDQVSYSDIGDGEYGGTNGNISSDPQFVDLAHGDYHVLPTSPVLDLGDSSYADLPATDFDGDPRVLGAAVDMGADETISCSVSMTKAVWPTGTVYSADVLTYTLALATGGPASAGGVLVTDTLPADVAWAGLAQASTGHVSVSDGVLTWLGTLPVTGTQTITYTVSVNPGSPVGTVIANTALVDDRTGGITETVPVTVTVGPGAFWDTSHQTVDKKVAQPGQQLVYTILVSNTGNAPATGVVVTDTLDGNVTFASASAGGVFSAGHVVWNGLTVNNDDQFTLTLAVTVNTPLTDAVSIANQAQVVGGGRPPLDLPTDDVSTLIYNPPQADFNATPTLGPVALAVTFGDVSQHGIDYLWSYGDGITGTATTTHAHTYTDAGVYTVTLRVTNPTGTDTLTRTHYITVYDRAVASFSGWPQTGLWPLVVEFTNNSLAADQFIWHYGDDVTSTITTTTHVYTYTSPGFYDVVLTAIGPYNSDTYTRTSYIAVYEHPIASFTGAPLSGVEPLLVSFADSSLYATSYQWDFGDGSISYAQDPVHLYLDGGVYTVTLKASNPGGSDTLIRPVYITVHHLPSAGFHAEPTVGLVPLTVTFTNTSQYADTYLWDYGDGSTGVSPAPTHTHGYTATGAFTVSLTASNPYGSDTYTRTDYIHVYDSPLADFSAEPLTGVAPLVVTFTNTSQYATDFVWTLGDGSTSTAVAPVHQYTAGGVYTVSLRASNPAASDWLTRTQYITVHDSPLPDFVGAPRIGTAPLAVTFTNTSQYADSYVWSYGDGVTSTVTAMTHAHVYTAAGSFTVSLTAVNVYGDSVITRTEYIDVYDTPLAGFVADPLVGVAPLQVSFTNTSQNATDFVWHLGDGVTSTAVAPIHQYMVGVYTVSLQASNPAAGDWLTRTSYIAVYHAPQPDFVGVPRIGIAPLVVTFTNTSQYADSYVWSYGDGVTSTVSTAVHNHTYAAPGVYTVSLSATNAYSQNMITRLSYVVVHPQTQAMVYYVDAINGSDATGDGSANNPWQTITYALSQVLGPNVEIRVASGLYDEALGEIFPLMMEPGVSLLGASYPATIISGNGSDDVIRFSSVVVYTETTVLSGFKIANGLAGVRMDGSTGVGSSPIVQANWITGNTYGIRNIASTSCKAYTVIRGNLISENTSYGIFDSANADWAQANATIEGNRIVNNGSGGIYGSSSASGYNTGHYSPLVVGNVIADNGGNGMTGHTSYAGRCSPQIVGNIFYNNQGWGVGRSQGLNYNVTSSPKLFNNVIVGNASGGALFITVNSSKRDVPTLVNNTIAHNNAYGVTGGWPTIVNCIVWGHDNNLTVSVDRVSYSDIGDGEYGGTNNNISSDPQFVDPAHGDCHVLSTSPVVDAGDSAYPDLPATDIDGDPRIMGAAVDIGADEVLLGLVVTKRAGADIVQTGSPLTYTIRITNTGIADLHATVTDTLPTQVTPTGIFTWTPTIAAPGGIWTQEIVVSVNPDYAGSLTNAVQVTTDEGVAGVYTETVTVLDVPIAGLGAVNDGPTPLGSATTLTATVTAGSNVSYDWAFGDGDVGSGAVVAHVYPGVGSYTAVITASNSAGSLTTTTPVSVTDVPIAGLGVVNDGPTPLGSATTLTATVTAGSNVTYDWAFGDGDVGSGAVVTHTYPGVGVYTAVVTASNSAGSLTTTTPVSVTDVPIAGLTAVNDGPTSLGSVTTLTATVTAGSNVSYTWAFDDGGFGYGAVVSYTWPTTGTYTAVVTASNSVNVVTATTSVSITTVPTNLVPWVYLPLVFKNP